MTSTSTDAAAFAPYFRGRTILRGRDDALLRQAFELRFQVYCQECHFLPSTDYPDRLEIDTYDPDSAHFCALNLASDLVGYVRLVREDAINGFPFRSHCSELLAGVELPPAGESAEISRLMVRQDYRRRRGDTLEGVNIQERVVTAAHERRGISPQILLSLYRHMYVFSFENNIRYWYAAMERPLARVLSHMHFPFRQIGPQTDYYGPVAPYVADLREVEADVGRHNPQLMSWLQSPESDLG